MRKILDNTYKLLLEKNIDNLLIFNFADMYVMIENMMMKKAPWMNGGSNYVSI